MMEFLTSATKRQGQEEVDEILYKVIWTSSDAAVVWYGLDKLANFCCDGEEANSYRLILCQDQRLSVITGAMIEWAENPEILSEACVVITNALFFREVDYETVGTTGLVQSVLKAMRKHRGYEYLQDNGCGALGNLLLHTRSPKELFVTTLDGLTAIAAAMKTFPGNACLQMSGCMVMSILAELPELKDHLIEAGCVELAGSAFRLHKNTQNADAATLRHLARKIPIRLMEA